MRQTPARIVAVLLVLVFVALALSGSAVFPGYVNRPSVDQRPRIVRDTVTCYGHTADAIICDTTIVWQWTLECETKGTIRGVQYRFSTIFSPSDTSAWGFVESGSRTTWHVPLSTILVRGVPASGAADSTLAWYQLYMHRD